MTRKEADQVILDLLDKVNLKFNNQLQWFRNRSSHINGVNIQHSFIISIDAYKNGMDATKGLNYNSTTIINLCKPDAVNKYKKVAPFAMNNQYYFIFDYETEKIWLFNNEGGGFIKTDLSIIEIALIENAQNIK